MVVTKEQEGNEEEKKEAFPDSFTAPNTVNPLSLGHHRPRHRHLTVLSLPPSHGELQWAKLLYDHLNYFCCLVPTRFSTNDD